MNGSELTNSARRSLRVAARWLAICLVLAACALPGAAQETPGTAESWRVRLQEAGDLLLAGSWVEGEIAVEDLVEEMSEQIVGGTGVDLLLGVATSYRAIAVAGQGRGMEAVWHWQVAQQLFPAVAELDLDRFGPEAAGLRLHTPRRPSAAAPPSARPDGVFVPPRRLASPRPRFPSARVFRGLEVDVVVQVVVGIDGRPSEPLVLESRGELTLLLAALEALREWTFEPATRDGVPEAALYRLTVSFVVPSG